MDKPSKDHKRWCKEDDALLVERSLLDVTNHVLNVNELAALLERTSGAINERLKHLRRNSKLPLIIRRRKGSWLFTLDILKYKDESVRSMAEKFSKELSIVGEYIYQCGLTIQSVRSNAKDPDICLISTINLNGIFVQLKVKDGKAYVLSGNIRNGYKPAMTW